MLIICAVQKAVDVKTRSKAEVKITAPAATIPCTLRTQEIQGRSAHDMSNRRMWEEVQWFVPYLSTFGIQASSQLQPSTADEDTLCSKKQPRPDDLIYFAADVSSSAVPSCIATKRIYRILLNGSRSLYTQLATQVYSHSTRKPPRRHINHQQHKMCLMTKAAVSPNTVHTV